MAFRALQRTTQRAFSSQASKPSLIQRVIFDAPSQSPLTEEFPGVPALSKTGAAVREVESTTLSNGLRVITRDTGAPVASIGVYVKAGSRFDSAAGTSHVLEHIAFHTTQKRSTAKIQRDLEDVGARVSSRTGREVFSYTGCALRENVEAVTAVLSEVMTQPKLNFWEVAEAKDVLKALIEAQEANPRHAILEGLHAAGFGPASTLGHSVIAGSDDLDSIDENVLRSFLGSRFTANNMVIVANNVKHDVFVDTCDKYFLSVPEGVAASNSAPGIHGPAKPVFVGGESLIRTQEGGAAHVAVGFSAPAASSKQVHALGVLQALLGGAGPHAGAAGAVRLGPAGQSRIGRSLHNDAHSFIRSITSFAFPYSDAGLFGIAGSCADHEAGRLVDAIAGFVDDAAKVAATAAELERAKKSYKLKLAAELDTSAGIRDDLGFQALLNGKTVTAKDTFKAIDAVSAADVQEVAKSIRSSKPAVSAVGSLSTLPRYDVLAARFQ